MTRKKECRGPRNNWANGNQSNKKEKKTIATTMKCFLVTKSSSRGSVPISEVRWEGRGKTRGSERICTNMGKKRTVMQGERTTSNAPVKGSKERRGQKSTACPRSFAQEDLDDSEGERDTLAGKEKSFLKPFCCMRDLLEETAPFLRKAGRSTKRSTSSPGELREERRKKKSSSRKDAS